MKRSIFHQVVGALVCSGRSDLAREMAVGALDNLKPPANDIVALTEMIVKNANSGKFDTALNSIEALHRHVNILAKSIKQAKKDWVGKGVRENG